MGFDMQYFLKQQRFFMDQVAYLQSRMKLKVALEAEIEELMKKIELNQALLNSMINNIKTALESDDSSKSPQ